jgi:prophage DNA circulation protein
MTTTPEWRQNLQPASYNSVPFGVTGTSTSTGRRVVSHEFPGRDLPYVEDLGAKATAYSIDAYVVGADYMSKRSALVAALTAQGPGTLIHPYLGKMRVQVDDVSWEETCADGGLAVIHLTFRQTANVVYPTSATNQAAAVSSAGSYLLVKAAAALHRNYVLTLETSSTTPVAAIEDAATESITDTVSVIDTAIRPSMATLVSGVLDQYVQNINNLSLDAAALISDPATLAYRYQAILSGLTSATDFISAFGAYNLLYSRISDYFSSKSYGRMAASQQAAANDAALEQSILLAILAYAAQMAVSANYQTYEQASQMKQAVSIMFDGVMYSTGDDDVYQSALTLKASTLDAIPPAGATLKDIITVKIRESVPSLVLAYAQYQSLDLEQDIIDRNGIENPFCIPGNSTLQLLTS